MSTLSSKACQNCNTEIGSTSQYCPNCGQKNTDGKITFSELWSEFQDATFNIESRTWRTLKALFIPGKLTLEYFSGKHRRYIHPLRLLLVSSVLVILAMSFQDFQSATNYHYNIKDQILENYERQRLYGILKNITDNTNATFPEKQTVIITDTILTTFRDSMSNLLSRYGDGYRDSIDLNFYVRLRPGPEENIGKHDFLKMDEDDLVATYKKEGGIIERLIFKQKVKFTKDQSQLFAAMVGHTTWAILLMMPCLALVLYFLYVRQNYYYIEHLIFTFHFQSFSFLVLTVLISGMKILPWWILLSFIMIIWIYLFISMRKVYNQSIGKTILKFFLLIISYGGLFILTLFGTLFVSFLLL